MARLYTITSQRQVQGLDAGRNLVDFYEVHYDGPNGITGSIRVEKRTASPELVDELIRRALGTQLDIAQLGEE
jgi:hypothetical protein